MASKLSTTMIATIRSAARKLTGNARRTFQAEACRDYCNSSARIAERTFGWKRTAVQRGLDEQELGTIITDAPGKGRTGYSKKLPHLQADIRSLVDPNTQTHPTFENTFRYTRMTAKAVLEALVREKRYKKKELPALSTMRELLGKMGYRLRRVQKTKPKKRFPKQKQSLPT
jgi:hypothetical protein